MPAIGRMKPMKNGCFGPVGTKNSKPAPLVGFGGVGQLMKLPHLCWLTLLVEHPLLMLKRHN